MSGTSAEGTTRRLVQLCSAYFFFYVITGVAVKYFLGKPDRGFPGFDGVQFLLYSTVGGNLICLAVVFAGRWYRLQSNGHASLGPLRFPREFYYIIPSGLCTAVVIPTTTLMYTLPISVMVAMVMMRGSVIIISRLVDAVQIRQGILKRRVYWQEDLAVVLALLAVGVDIVGVRGASFDFVHSPAALMILGSYIVAYAFRIYIMNFYKNTRAPGVKLHNQGFFAIEQLTATVVMASVAAMLFFSPWKPTQLELFRGAITHPRPEWGWAILAGVAYGLVAFFSVFIFMFKGRTATFAGLVNRLTSLVAGTMATMLFAVKWGGELPKPQDWLSLGFILAAVGCLTLAERKRASEPPTVAATAATATPSG